jgi:hypothetical protein
MKPQLSNKAVNRDFRICGSFIFEWLIMLASSGREYVTKISILNFKKKV